MTVLNPTNVMTKLKANQRRVKKKKNGTKTIRYVERVQDFTIGGYSHYSEVLNLMSSTPTPPPKKKKLTPFWEKWKCNQMKKSHAWPKYNTR